MKYVEVEVKSLLLGIDKDKNIFRDNKDEEEKQNNDFKKKIHHDKNIVNKQS